MGTTLTGTTPQDTYDSLIKVTDNGPLSGTLKKLTDGLGNDSSLSLSTTAASFSGNVNALGSLNGFAGATQNLLIDWSSSSQMTTLTNTELFFGTNAQRRLTITAAGNVGIGTSSPAQKLDVAGRVKAAGDDYHTFVVDQGSAQLRLERTGTSTGVNYIGSDNRGLVILDSSFGAKAIFTANGLTFNGDTAAANALDDYEEGTWTPTITFDGASVGISYGAGNAGQYTKVGRQVTLTAFIVLTSKGSSTGTARIGGLPFVIGNATGYYSAPALGAFNQLSFGGTLQGFGNVGAQTIELNEASEAGVQSPITNADFTDSSSFLLSFTYFV